MGEIPSGDALMVGILLDTHAIIWFFLNSSQISKKAVLPIEERVQTGAPIFLAAISLVEIIYLIEKGRIPQIALDRLEAQIISPDSPLKVIPLDIPVAQSLRKIPRKTVSDMPDRIIAATALHHSLPLVTSDSKIRLTGIETIW